MVGLLHAMAFMVLLLVGWVIWNNKPLPLPWRARVTLLTWSRSWCMCSCLSRISRAALWRNRLHSLNSMRTMLLSNARPSQMLKWLCMPTKRSPSCAPALSLWLVRFLFDSYTGILTTGGRSLSSMWVSSPTKPKKLHIPEVGVSLHEIVFLKWHCKTFKCKCFPHFLCIIANFCDIDLESEVWKEIKQLRSAGILSLFENWDDLQ